MIGHNEPDDEKHDRANNDQPASSGPHVSSVANWGLISSRLGTYLKMAGRRRPIEATRPASRPPSKQQPRR